ncbi:hypothetical protein [Bradyrhizobium sp. CCBAU 11361]|uniref:hypothetical protein n=1 Tax=Bradyrhizobium sp. CCBAU 11361 TaxID=1630812 RepID=UPI0023036A06|nr:hypothetical protein [Bradyrhizobium sp. CCBAU 11361]
MAMKIGGSYKFSEVLPRHWRRQAEVMKMDPDEMITRFVGLGEKISDALSEVVKGARGEDLTEPVLDTMLDGISARGKAIVQQYSA